MCVRKKTSFSYIYVCIFYHYQTIPEYRILVYFVNSLDQDRSDLGRHSLLHSFTRISLITLTADFKKLIMVIVKVYSEEDIKMPCEVEILVIMSCDSYL